MTATWPMKPGTSSGDWELPPAGNMAAVCVALIDLGTQQDSWQGQPKDAHQLAIVWELAGMVSAKTGKNHVVCKKFNASLHPKANFRKALETWRGQPIRDDEDFDIFKIVGAPCLLQVSHDKTNSGNDIYYIDAVTGLPKGMAKPTATHHPLIKFKIDHEMEIPEHDWLPLLDGRKIADVIRESFELRERQQQQAEDQRPPAAGPLSAPTTSHGDDIPF